MCCSDASDLLSEPFDNETNHGVASRQETGSLRNPFALRAGGIGEVCLAKDSKLDRQVAIKVLPESMTRDPERVARFEREAKLLVSLNHPNIAAIYGFDDSNGTRFLVMEYVEGETLGSHLKKGPVAVEDALDIAKQIAEALEAAHEEGVIHRGLKPGNVMIRPCVSSSPRPRSSSSLARCRASPTTKSICSTVRPTSFQK